MSIPRRIATPSRKLVTMAKYTALQWQDIWSVSRGGRYNQPSVTLLDRKKNIHLLTILVRSVAFSVTEGSKLEKIAS